MFEIKPITRTFKAKALTNPFPSFVSLVKAGANQRPIRAIKMDGFASEENSDMKIQRADAKIAALITTGFDLVSLSFDKASFADTTAVKAWLDAGGYADYEIVESKKGFEVVNGAARVETGTARKVQADTGVSAFIARSHVVDGGDETGSEGVVDDIAAAGANATKADEPVADKPKDEANLGEILEAAPVHTDVIDTTIPEDEATAERADAVQPVAAEQAVGAVEGDGGSNGVVAEKTEGEVEGGEGSGLETPEEVVAAKGDGEDDADITSLIERAETALKALTDKGVEVSATKGACFYAVGYIADVIQTLRYLIADADWNGLSEATVATLKTSAKAALEGFIAAADDVAAEYADALKSAAPAVTETVELAAEPVAPAIDMTVLAKMIGDTVTASLAPVNEAIAGVTARVEEVASSVSTTKADLDQRVKALSERGQARKGADLPVTNVDTPSTTDTKQPVQASRGMLAAMGSRHARD